MIKVAVVEDDPLVAKFHRIYLEKLEGFKWVGLADTFAKAETLLKEEKSFDLLLLDVYLHERSGLELLKHIRAEELNVDVILITSANDQRSVQVGYRYGVIDYLIKPFTFERFQESLLRYKKKMAQQPPSFRQEEVDRLFHSQKDKRSAYALPKGITKETKLRILKAIQRKGDWVTAAELSSFTTISHVSLRKYLHYFEENGWVRKDVVYQRSGRPLQQYRMTPDGTKLFEENDFV
ncbi:response regulator [Shouchella shacheensis]|uniref:response regulator n=1 Tax=Shouchella shacheensis TaxID=1649580 RepID=UPI000740480E|nr:response regulator [Shouchella shacheensis]